MSSLVVEDSNLSVAWIRAFSALAAPGVRALEPVVVTVTGFDDGVPEEIHGVRALIDEALAQVHMADEEKRQSNGKGRRRPRLPLTCHTVANTIFPASMWAPGNPRELLYSRYRRALPKLKRDPRNAEGLYFERLVAFGRGPCEGNQLEHLIGSFTAGVNRVSAFQMVLCDPDRDVNRSPYQGFPCLQQIAVHPDRKGGSLSLTGFYGTQYLFERAYGNYLGLCRLGRFIAHAMDLTLTRMTCIASYAPLYLSKYRATQLATDAARVAGTGSMVLT